MDDGHIFLFFLWMIATLALIITQIPKKQGMGFHSTDSFLYHIPDNPSPPNSIKLAI
jgi:hypothetical protein